MCIWLCIPPATSEDPPDTNQLRHIQELDDDIVNIDSSDPGDLFQTEKLTLISNVLLPIRNKLVQRVEEGLFVEMAELLPSYLDAADSDANRVDYTIDSLCCVTSQNGYSASGCTLL